MGQPPKLVIKFVEPGDKLPKRPKPTFEEIGLKGDMSQFYVMKSLFEQLLGKPTYMRLKESAHFPSWKAATAKLLDAMHFSIKTNVQVADAQWFRDVEEIITDGKERIARAETIADLFAYLSATLIELSFTQLGMMPTRSYPPETIPLKAQYWTLSRYRTVQYIQSPQQQAAVQTEQKRQEENRLKAAERESN
jgi:hypothetical protein